MNLEDVTEEMAARLETITGLRVFDYDADQIHPDAALIGMPERITFDATYGRGSDTMSIPVLIIVGRTDSRAAFARLKPYAAGTGAKSIKAALDSTNDNPYESCDVVRVSSVEFPVYVSGSIKYLSAEFTVDIDGPGSP